MTDLPEEETVRSRRTARATAQPPEPGSAEVTAGEALSTDTATVPSTAAPDVPPLRRATYIAARNDEDGTTSGSTFVARRETRRRAARSREAGGSAEAPAAESGSALPRSGAVPAHAASAPAPGPFRYGPRPAEPVIAHRSGPPPRSPQRFADGAAASLAHRRAGRRRALIVVLAAFAVAIGAAASLLALALQP